MIYARKAKKKFDWTDKHQRAFDLLKQELSSEPCVRPYSPQEEVTLTTDASKDQIGACLTQNGHPVIFVSKSLTPAEQNYSNIEREAYAVVWSVQRLRQFLLGRRFTLQTDHKPLEFIFAPDKSLSGTVSARLTRWALALMPYDFTILHVSGSTIPHADALSRLKFSMANEEEFIIAVVEEFEKPPIDILKIKRELEFEPLGQAIFERIISGKWSDCSKAEEQFKRIKESLTVEDGIIYVGTRVYIPASLRQASFAVAHDIHQGINSTMNKMKKSVWWPGMDVEIQRWMQQCSQCNLLRPRTKDETFKWPEVDPWNRLHMDWAYTKALGNVLIIVDSGSGWLEAHPCKNRSSESIIHCLRKIFCSFGVPHTIVSDNA